MHRRLERNSLSNGVSNEASGYLMSEESEHEELERSCVKNKHNGNSNEDGLAINDTGYCALCGKTSVCKCERCGDFYCSPQCQRRDWANHRFICFPMPRLVKAVHKSAEKETLPILKAEGKSIEISKEESRQAFKARQLSYIPSSTALPEDGNTVVLTAFKSSNRCYIRSADAAITEEYNSILKKIDTFGKHATEVKGVPKAHTFAIAQRNEKWCRVQILSARPENRIRVHFIDYGVTSVLNLRELRRIAGNVSSLPCYVNMVQLHGVTMYSMQEKVLHQLSQNTDKEFKIKIVEPDDKGGNIQLFHMDTNQNLNSEIIQICQECSETENEPTSNTSTTSFGNDDADNVVGPPKGKDTPLPTLSDNDKAKNLNVDKTPQKCVTDYSTPKSLNKTNSLPVSEQIEKPCMVPPFKTVHFDVNAKNFRVIVVDSSYVSRGYLGCILESDCDNFRAVSQFLENFKGSGEPYKPKLDEYCIAKFESEWYRAKVVEILDKDKFLVAYIDFGNESELSSASIRRYPIDLTLPCRTNLCAIEGLPEELSDKLVAHLELELSAFKKIMVDRVKMLDDVMFIECKQLLKELHECKLL